MGSVVRALVVAALVLTLGACRSSTSPSQPVDVRVTVPFGQSITVGDGSVGLRFNGVPEDSRCPGDALCVWAGRAIVDLTLLVDGKSVGLQLRTEPAGMRTVVEGITIELVQLEPYPFASRPHQPGDYKLTLRILR